MTAVAKEENVPWKSTENVGSKTSPRIDDEMFGDQYRIGDHFVRFFQHEGCSTKKNNELFSSTTQTIVVLPKTNQ
jgi:hypothetical protein